MVGWNHVPTMLNRLPRGSQLRATKATGKCDSRSCPGRAWAKGAGWSRICVEGKDMERQAKPKVFFFLLVCESENSSVRIYFRKEAVDFSTSLVDYESSPFKFRYRGQYIVVSSGSNGLLWYGLYTVLQIEIDRSTCQLCKPWSDPTEIHKKPTKTRVRHCNNRTVSYRICRKCCHHKTLPD